ncbi:hypothetical protein KXX47_001085, partial [Aspergillus fumigatus]
ACKKRGLAGVIVDAAIRDKLEILELDFPVFSAGFNPAGPTKYVPGRINHPISAGGAVVNPGDLVVGDADGVVSVRNAAATAQLWAGALGARAGAIRTLQRGRRYPMRVTEFKARGRTVVALREVVGLAHAWSGGAARIRRPAAAPANRCSGRALKLRSRQRG